MTVAFPLVECSKSLEYDEFDAAADFPVKICPFVSEWLDLLAPMFNVWLMDYWLIFPGILSYPEHGIIESELQKAIYDTLGQYLVKL